MKFFRQLLWAFGIVILMGVVLVFANMKVSYKQLLTDGNMEAGDVSAWIVTNNATLTKETTDPREGSQSLRVAYNGSNNPSADQTILTSDQTYRVTGWARGDGVTAGALPRVRLMGGSLWTGTNSNIWQKIDEVGIASGTALKLYSNLTESGYVEFDGIFVTEYLPPVKINDKQLLVDGDMENNWDGNELLADNDMETGGIGDWNIYREATLTKEVGARTGGVGTQVLRTTYATLDQAGGSQDILSSGKTYHTTGWTRSDGSTGRPQLWRSGGTLWNGAISTDWQYFDLAFEYTNGVTFALLNQSSGGWVEWDDVSVKEITSADYVAFDSIISKHSGRADSGDLVLRVTGDRFSAATVVNYTVGKIYRVTGWARGDGVDGRPVIGGIETSFSGTTSNSWQRVDFFGVATQAGTTLYQYGVGSSDTSYAEYDDIFVTEYLPPTKISSLYKGLVFWSPLTDTWLQSPTLASDRANGNHATSVRGTPTYSQNGVELDGSTDSLNFTIPTIFDTTELTIALRFTPDFAPDENAIRYFFHTAENTNVRKRINAFDNLLRVQYNGVNVISIAEATYSPFWNVDEENTLIVNYNSGDTNVWMNGNQIATNEPLSFTAESSTTMDIGSRGDTNEFDGEIRDFRIYNRTLTDAERAQFDNSSF